MAVTASTDVVFTYNSVDLSSFVESVTVTVDGVVLDYSAVNSAWVKNKLGRKSFAVNVTFFDDLADNSVDETLWSAFSTGTNVAFTWKGANTTVGAGNPEYQGTVVPQYGGIGGAGGELLKKTVTFTGDGTLTRDITP